MNNTCIKPSLKQTFIESVDIRVLIDLISKYDYTDDEAPEVINIYELDENGKIPEVEHIEVMLLYFPNSNISQNTLDGIKNSFPNELEYINRLKNTK